MRHRTDRDVRREEHADRALLVLSSSYLCVVVCAVLGNSLTVMVMVSVIEMK